MVVAYEDSLDCRVLRKYHEVGPETAEIQLCGGQQSELFGVAISELLGSSEPINKLNTLDVSGLRLVDTVDHLHLRHTNIFKYYRLHL